MFSNHCSQDDLCDLIIEEDAKDLLEARIEIKAQPRGKRPSGISQLWRGKHSLPSLYYLVSSGKTSPFVYWMKLTPH